MLARENGKDAQAAVMALLDRYAGRPVQAIDQRSLVAHAEVRALPSRAEWQAMSAAERTRFLERADVGELPSVIDLDEPGDL